MAFVDYHPVFFRETNVHRRSRKQEAILVTRRWLWLQARVDVREAVAVNGEIWKGSTQKKGIETLTDGAKPKASWALVPRSGACSSI